MERFERLTGKAAPLPAANIDTDIIFPARFLLITEKKGLGRFAFYEWRTLADGAPNADFELNMPLFQGATILVTGDNFGCGSSREQACWALRDVGIRVVIATSFGEIFHANCFKNGMLPITVTADDLALLMADAIAAKLMTVDLEQGTLTRPEGQPIRFETEGWRREALLSGWDEIDIINKRSATAIDAHEGRAHAATPWLYQGD